MNEITVGTSKYKIIRITSGAFEYDIQGHTHADRSYEIHYSYAGLGTLKTADKSFKLEADTIYINGPNVWHTQTVDKDNPLAEICIYIQLESTKNDLISRFFNSTQLYCGRGNAYLKDLFFKAAYLNEQNNIFANEKEKSVIQLIITELAEMFSPNTISPEKLTVDDEKFYIIESAFLHDYSKITLDELSIRLSISQRQTQRLLQKHYGKTFRQKKKEAQIDAALLLIQQGKSINEVSQTVGYSDTPSFIRAFKSIHGKTPNYFKAD